MGYRNCKYLIINAFALSGRMYESYYSRGAATLCPGLCARCPGGARSFYVRTIMLFLILLTNLTNLFSPFA